MLDIVRVARTKLVSRYPFFGSIVLRHEAIETKAVETACVDTKGIMYYNPDFIQTLNVNEVVFVLAHEALHIVFAHLARRGKRDSKMWNIVNDGVVNDLLERLNVGQPIKGCIRMPGAYDTTSEKLYEQYKNDQQNGGGSGGGVSGDLVMEDLPPGDGGTGEDDPTPDQVKQAIANGKMEIAQAMASARMQGKCDGTLAGLIGKYLESKVPWYDLLEKFMMGRAEQRSNWNRPSRRYMNYAYMPKRDRFPSMGDVVIGIDVSGSIGDEEVRKFIGHVVRIAEQCHPKRTHVVYCTTHVEHVDEFEEGELPTPQPNRWCGGTDMRAIMEYIDKNGIEPDCCIVLTDGYTDVPEEQDYPLVWALTEKHSGSKFPGEVLFI